MVFFRFLFFSIVIHAALALALAWYLTRGPKKEISATLDLSSVEFSFAAEERETTSAQTSDAASPSAQDQPRARLSPRLEAAPEEAPLDALPLPPQPEISVSEPVLSIVEEAPRQARVDAPPRPYRTIKPDYPRLARQKGHQGDVVLEFEVSSEGKVSSLVVVTSSGFGELDEAAVKAVQSAVFTPAKSGDATVASTARLKLSFRLR